MISDFNFAILLLIASVFNLVMGIFLAKDCKPDSPLGKWLGKQKNAC